MQITRNPYLVCMKLPTQSRAGETFRPSMLLVRISFQEIAASFRHKLTQVDVKQYLTVGISLCSG